MQHIIRIEVDTTGNFTYLPALQRVQFGDTVSWVCPLHPFAILFRTRSPFVEGMEASANAGIPSNPLTVANVKGQYHYAIAVYNGSRVFMDSDCAGLLAN
jgi:hypothetical protein